MRRAFVLVTTSSRSCPRRPVRAGRSTRRPSSSSTSGCPIHLGPLDLSITKAVVYLMIGTVADDRARDQPDALRVTSGSELGRRQSIGEQIYEIAQTQVAEQGLPTKAIGRWFPYVATLMLFIWVVNMLGFIPLPLTGETWHGVPTWGIYAATSSLSVTLALALLTFVFTHFEGIRWNGPVRYFKSWIPEAPKALLVLIVPLEILGQFMRLISLSVRLFANMLAGPHPDPHVHRPDVHPAVDRARRGRRADRRGLLSLRSRDRRLDPGVHLRRSVRHLHRLGNRAGTLGGTPHAFPTRRNDGRS